MRTLEFGRPIEVVHRCLAPMHDLAEADAKAGPTHMTTATDTRTQLLAAGKSALLESGYAELSTRRIADAAGVPLSQIHYHFGSRQNLVLAVLADENARLLERQSPSLRRRDAGVAAVGAGLRLPRGRPAVGLRPGPAGDDRRRLVRRPDRRGGAGQPHRLVRTAHRHRIQGRTPLRRPRPVHRRRRSPPSPARCSSGWRR